MSPLISGVLAFAVCACSLPLAIRAAAHWRLYDEPGDLKIHRAPVPRIGGFAMMIGFFAATFPFWGKLPDGFPLTLMAVFGVWATGLIDDIRGLPPLLRLVIHIAAGS